MTPIRRDDRQLVHLEIWARPWSALVTISTAVAALLLGGVLVGFMLGRSSGASIGAPDAGVLIIAQADEDEAERRRKKPTPPPPPPPAPKPPEQPPRRPDPVVDKPELWSCPPKYPGEYGPDCRGQ